MIGLSPRTDRLPAGSLTDAEAEAAKARTGLTMGEAAKTLLDQFDDDGDGNLFHQKTFLGMRFGSELRTTTAKVTYTLGLLVGRPEHDFVKVTTRTTWSLGRLLQKADVDRDDMASHREILEVLKGYDTDGDGRLSTEEFLRVRAEVGATKAGTWRTIEAVERRKGR
jgi:hypothetical protein